MELNDRYFLNPAHLELARARYFLKDENGEPVEQDIDDVFNRVVNYIYQDDPEHKEEALELRREKKIIDAGRPLAQAGTEMKNLYNCFVESFGDYKNQDPDTREAISELKRKHFNIQAQGGGVGINFSSLRPAGSICKSNQSRSSGAVGFITDFSYQSSNISQGGNRSGANLGVLGDWHPDLYDFITHKTHSNWENIRRFATVYDEDAFSYFQWQRQHEWQMFNVSVLLSDEFMSRVINKDKSPWVLRWKETEWPLWRFRSTIGPKTGSKYDYEMVVTAPSESLARYKSASSVPFFNKNGLELVEGPYHMSALDWFDIICKSAHEDGCPGILFMDMAKRYHNGEYFNPLSAANPCAEEPLPAGGVCCLASLVLPTFFQSGEFLWPEFEKAIYQAVRGLDNIISLSKTGEKSIDENAITERRIGLGTTGAAELLIMAGLKYSSQKGRDFIAQVMEFLRDKAYEASIEISKERGAFPAYEYKGFSQSEFFKTLPEKIQNLIRRHGIRNVTILCQAPVGTTGTMLGYSTGCEPYFAMSFLRNSRVGSFLDGSPSFMMWLHDNGINYADYDYSLAKLKKKFKVPDYFEEAHEISWQDHLKMQAVFSKYVDASVSKCVAKGTLVNTNYGIIPIEKFSEGFDKEDCFNNPDKEYTVLDEYGNIKKVTSHYYGGKKPCLKLRFSNGFSITSTYNHKYKTERGFVRADDLKVGDKVLYRTNHTDTDQSIQKIEPPNFRNNKIRKFPEYMNEDYALFLGMWLADGFTNINSIGISEKSDTVCNVVEGLMKKIFGEHKVFEDKRNGVRTHLINSRALVGYFRKHYGKDSATKKIPDEIMQSPKQIQIALLRGLTLDGYVKRGNLVVYEGYSKDIVIKVSHILSSLGIRYYIGEKGVPTGRLSKTTYSVVAVGSDIIEPIESHKKDRMNNGAISNYQVFIDKNLQNKIVESFEHNTHGNWKRRSARSSFEKDSFIMKRFIDNAPGKESMDIDYNLSCVSVTDIEDAGIKDVYDIEVEDTHSYMINGIVTHNTINLPNSATVDDVKNAYLQAYKMGIKSTTVYRDGSKQQILETIKKEKEQESKRPKDIVRAHAPERPKELPCDIHHTSVKGDRWTVLVGLLDGRPYEVFCASQDNFEIAPKYKSGTLVKNGGGSYYLDTGDFKLKNISSYLNTDEHRVITRLISTCLRHGVPMPFISEQLAKADGTVVDFSKAVLRVLKKYGDFTSDTGSKEVCSTCGSSNVVINSGCPECLDCGTSKCG